MNEHLVRKRVEGAMTKHTTAISGSLAAIAIGHHWLTMDLANLGMDCSTMRCRLGDIYLAHVATTMS